MSTTASPRAQFTVLCGIRKEAPLGNFTLRAGDWPFARLTIDQTNLRVGPSIGPLVAFLAAIAALGLVTRAWYLGLIAAGAAAFAVANTPRVRWPLAGLRARREGFAGRSLRLESPESADPLWVW